jgi:hypothetical protein
MRPGLVSPPWSGAPLKSCPCPDARAQRRDFSYPRVARSAHSLGRSISAQHSVRRIDGGQSSGLSPPARKAVLNTPKLEGANNERYRTRGLRQDRSYDEPLAARPYERWRSVSRCSLSPSLPAKRWKPRLRRGLLATLSGRAWLFSNGSPKIGMSV